MNQIMERSLNLLGHEPHRPGSVASQSEYLSLLSGERPTLPGRKDTRETRSHAGR
jgi:hypothetical protein